ncbi:hypothetical protein ANCCAN_10836 [Ancylostoma caninum]|uniref:7TM GPCR serpentine receptor class x (Srx) domain-containing protein n=1 Tax=Ancylostoma caninum TaxID=29170 RepID=A0A368GFM9_ANCCA|nr:hypothetical protein ANCCAN_10836 [Ancylostoma caninum]
MAIAFPMKYRIWFTNSATFGYLIFITAYASLYWGIYFVDTCDFRFSHDSRVWEFGTEPCSVYLSIYIDMVYNLCLFAVVAIIDMITIAHLRKLNKVRGL